VSRQSRRPLLLLSHRPGPIRGIEIWAAQAVLGKTIGLVGGIEPLHFLNLDLPGLRAYFEDLLERMDHRRWILANSDNWSVIAHCRSRRSCAARRDLRGAGRVCGQFTPCRCCL